MMKEIAKLGRFTIRRDDRTGIALVSDGSGLQTGVHASIDKTGSVIGMKQNGGWHKKDRVVASAGFKFNVDTFVCDVTEEAERLAAMYCECIGCRERRARNAGKAVVA